MSRVAAIVLAAGLASRFRAAANGIPTKLVAELDGMPLVRHVALAAVASRARPILVVTGHARPDVEAALDGLDLDFGHNPDFATGLSSSLRVGLQALPAEVSGALVLLGDMPLVRSNLIDRLIAAHEAAPHVDAVVPLSGGRRGNPVLLGRALFAPAARLSGDEGARRLLAQANVLDIEVAEDAVAVDIDDPDMLRRAQTRASPSSRSSQERGDLF